MTTRPRPRELRPAESYTSLTGVTIAFAAEPHPQPHSHAAPSSSSSAGKVPRPLATHAAARDDAASRRFGLVARPKLHTSESALSVVSSTSTTSDLVVSASGPMPSPFFVPPPAKPLRHLAHSTSAEPSHDDAQRAPSPFPRPESPLPALPSSSSTTPALVHPSAPPPLTSPYPAPPTAHNSLAAFKAAQAAADSQGGCSSSTHRTSSDVDLDLSFERASALRDSRGSSSLLHDELVVEAHEHEHERERDGGEHDWVRDEVRQHESPRPAVHGIPERDLVRSSSGQLVGARHARATSAMDLRAQFKAAADADAEVARGADDVAITIGALGSTAGEWRYGDDGDDGEGEYDAVRRHVIRQGKRPLEGARAQHEHDQYALTAPLEHVARFGPSALSPHERAHDGDAGFAYNATGALWREPPRSAPPLSQPTFADRQQEQQQQQQQGHASRPSQSRGFPLPLRLLQHTKRSAEALMSPASAFARSPTGTRARAATAGTVAESDLDSLAGASPMFDSDGEHDGTVRTAPSTPNDTPLFQDCFDSDETTPPLPLPHRLGASAALAGLGLGFDFGERDAASDEGRDEFPLVPLRHGARRVSLPPVADRRRSVRHDKIPSLSISPPPPVVVVEERSSEDGARSVATSSSTLSSHDSGVDPTVSPSRRLSRRLSLAVAGPTADPASRPPPPRASRPSVHFDTTRSTSFPFLHKTDTPSSTTSSSAAGPSIPTPQHLLVSPSPGPGGIKRDPSFSFSPAPLRLVKVQLLRAAGYGTGSGSSTEAPAAEDARPASPGAPVEATVDVAAAVGDGETAARSRRPSPVAWWDDLGGWFQAPSGWVDEVVPAKLAFLVRPLSAFSPSRSRTRLTPLLARPSAGRLSLLRALAVAPRRVVPAPARRRVPLAARRALQGRPVRLRAHHARLGRALGRRCGARAGGRAARRRRRGRRRAVRWARQVGVHEPGGGDWGRGGRRGAVWRRCVGGGDGLRRRRRTDGALTPRRGYRPCTFVHPHRFYHATMTMLSMQGKLSSEREKAATLCRSARLEAKSAARPPLLSRLALGL